MRSSGRAPLNSTSRRPHRAIDRRPPRRSERPRQSVLFPWSKAPSSPLRDTPSDSPPGAGSSDSSTPSAGPSRTRASDSDALRKRCAKHACGLSASATLLQERPIAFRGRLRVHLVARPAQQLAQRRTSKRMKHTPPIRPRRGPARRQRGFVRPEGGRASPMGSLLVVESGPGRAKSPARRCGNPRTGPRSARESSR
jgi:hypothetical protein